MKEFLKNVIIYLYFAFSLSVLCTAMITPFLLASKEKMPNYFYWAIAALTIIVSASMPIILRKIFSEPNENN